MTVAAKDNPRIHPPVPRNSDRWSELIALRSGCERSNAVKKGGLNLEQARHRRASFWLVRLHTCAILQHAKAWVAEIDAKAWLRGFIDTGQLMAA